MVPLNFLTQNTEGIALAYLFGSQAELGLALLQGRAPDGPVDPLSDLDLGVIFYPGRFPEDPLHTYGRLYNELCDLFLPYRLDLVFLQETDSVFQFEVMTRGILIYKGDEAFRQDYLELIWKFAMDWKFELDLYYREMAGAMVYERVAA